MLNIASTDVCSPQFPMPTTQILMGTLEHSAEHASGEYFFFLSMLFNSILFYYLSARTDFPWSVIRFPERFPTAVLPTTTSAPDVDRSHPPDTTDTALHQPRGNTR